MSDTRQRPERAHDPAGEDRRMRAEGGFRDSFRWDVIRSTPRYAYLVAGVAALGGMLFGYDIGVISGAEKLLTARFKLSAGIEEFAVASVLIGSIIGGVFGGRLADRISRRYALVTMAVIYTVGAIATALAPSIALFIVFRIVVGIAVGASSMVVPTYIAELSPRQIRGGLVILQQLAISGGIFLSYIWDYISFKAGWGWRPMFAAAAVPGIALGVGMLYMSHTPRWLGMQGRWDEADEVMGRVNPNCKDEELQRVREDLEEGERGSLRELLRPGRPRRADRGARAGHPAAVRGTQHRPLLRPDDLRLCRHLGGLGWPDGRDLRRRGAVRVRAADDRARRRGRAQAPVLHRARRDGEHARPARPRLPLRRVELGRRRADHPARLHRLLLAEHLAAVLADDSRALSEPIAGNRRQHRHRRQLVGEPAHHRDLPDRRGRAWARTSCSGSTRGSPPWASCSSAPSCRRRRAARSRRSTSTGTTGAAGRRAARPPSAAASAAGAVLAGACSTRAPFYRASARGRPGSAGPGARAR